MMSIVILILSLMLLRLSVSLSLLLLSSLWFLLLLFLLLLLLLLLLFLFVAVFASCCVLALATTLSSVQEVTGCAGWHPSEHACGALPLSHCNHKAQADMPEALAGLLGWVAECCGAPLVRGP